ncbi:hypothetical protein ACLKA6_016420 [Drosophila palustris]
MSEMDRAAAGRSPLSVSETSMSALRMVSKIQERTKGMIWHHVPTQLNPADILSRGCTPELLNNHLWAEGPVSLTSAQWPQAISYPVDLPERRHNALITSAQTDLSTCCKFQNTFGMLQRVFAYIDRFLGICNKELARRKGLLTIDYIKRGTQLLIKSIQLFHFAEDCRALRSGKQLSTKSEIRSLQPILDHAGLLRVGGRLQNSDLDYEAKHPLLLPRRHPVTAAIYYQRFLHAGSPKAKRACDGTLTCRACATKPYISRHWR